MTAYSSLAVREPMTSAVHSSFSKIAKIQMAGSQIQNVNKWFEKVGEFYNLLILEEGQVLVKSTLATSMC